jgi:hypothetical protein
MVVKGKITQSAFKKEWPGPKGITYFHDIKIEGCEHLLNIGAKEKDAKHIAVGQQIEVEANEGEYGWKCKVVREAFTGGGNKGGGFKEKVTSLEELKRMAKGSAVKAAGTVNGIHQHVLIDGKGCNTIAAYVLGDIDGPLLKWDDPKTSLMISRQTALHAAADETTARNIQSVEELIEHATNKYKYITS